METTEISIFTLVFWLFFYNLCIALEVKWKFDEVHRFSINIANISLTTIFLHDKIIYDYYAVQK